MSIDLHVDRHAEGVEGGASVNAIDFRSGGCPLHLRKAAGELVESLLRRVHRAASSVSRAVTHKLVDFFSEAVTELKAIHRSSYFCPLSATCGGHFLEQQAALFCMW